IVDLIIFLLLIAALLRGMRFGLLQLLLSSAGFFVGIVLGFWVAKFGSSHLTSQSSRAFLVIAAELLLAIAFSSLGELVGIKLAKKAHAWHLGGVNRY